MRFPAVSALLGLGLSLSTTVLADRMIIWQYCYFSCTYPAIFYTSAGSYDIDASDGCRGTSVPGMTEFCVDHRNSRGHFKFSHQNYKRCMIETSNETSDCGIAFCINSYWDEVPCTWGTGRMGEIEGGEVENVSAASNSTALATATGGTFATATFIA
ncbi:hypothetical protein VTL71DRAFT_8049 [Oculimacula yallundae]|uniref:Uncharacterized protein n=1 Tax=Oculimacula yallundae TaxID=86028 RepID=A0ABR4CXQ7_9HELO